MTSSTTLMTFLVKVPPHTWSVNLLGSWDNFSKPYCMKRDSRLGPEHWTGCYNFENILCDGNVGPSSGTRRGGLKMGGTYWYYYQLDNDIDYHDPAEPSTTSCPMLPGQPVNVLNVPIQLSSGERRQRNASVSSSSSDLRTMDPDDRYLNPRPAPNPALARLDTHRPHKSAPNASFSPTSQPGTAGRSHHSRNVSLPSSTVSLRHFRLPPKNAKDGRGRSVSPPGRAAGLRAALRHLGPPKRASQDEKACGGRPRSPASGRERFSLDHFRSHNSDEVIVDWLDKSPIKPAPTPVEQDISQSQNKELALRKKIKQLDSGGEGFSVPSFQGHRKQRSGVMEPSPLCGSSISAEPPRVELSLREGAFQAFQPLETLTEGYSIQGTPACPSSGSVGRDAGDAGTDHIPALSGKSLPTFPKAAASPDPMSKSSEIPQKDVSNAEGGLRIGLIKASDSAKSASPNAQCHFSQLTSTTTASSFASSQWSSVFFDGKSPSSFGECTSRLTSPYEMNPVLPSPDVVKGRERLSAAAAYGMPSIICSSTMSSSDNMSSSSPISEGSETARPPKEQPAPVQKRYGMMLGNFQALPLPLSGSMALNYHLADPADGEGRRVNLNRVRMDAPRGTPEEVPHSTSMRHLLDELRYLGDMIRG